MKRRGALALMALGILLAGGASVLVLGIARQAGEASRTVVPQVYVVMATREIPDQAQIAPEALVVRPFPAEFAPPGAISAPEQAVGKFAVGTIYPDQILMTGHVSTARRSPTMSDRVPPGKVVVWLPMPELIAGQVGLRAGDRLDILLSLQIAQNGPAREPSEEPAPVPTMSTGSALSTQTTLQNIEIFAIGDPTPAAPQSAQAGTAFNGTGGSPAPQSRPSTGGQPLALLVDHQDALIIKYIKDSGGTIDFALRSSDEDRIVRTDAETIDSIAERFRFRVPQDVRP